MEQLAGKDREGPGQAEMRLRVVLGLRWHLRAAGLWVGLQQGSVILPVVGETL